MYIGCFDTRADWHLLTVLVSLTEEGYFHSLFPCKGAYRELVLKVGVENFGPLRLKKSSEPALSRSNSLRLRVFKIESWGCDFFSIFHWSYFVATGSAVVSPWVVSDSLWPCGLWPTRFLCPRGSPGKNTEVCCHALLQGIFWTPGWTCISMSPTLQAYSLPTEPPGISLFQY